MIPSAKTPPRQNGGLTSFFSTVKLARWQTRQAWRLLLVTGVGMLTAVVLICAVPLYSQIVISAGVRDAVNSAPEGPYVTVHSSSDRFRNKPPTPLRPNSMQNFNSN